MPGNGDSVVRKVAIVSKIISAILLSEALIESLSNSSIFSLARVPSGSNVFALTFADGTRDPGRHARFVELLRTQQIIMPQSVLGKYLLRVNTSLIGTQPAKLASALISAAIQA